MQRIVPLMFLFTTILLVSCGKGKTPIEKKKAEIEKLKKEQAKLSDEITTLENEFALLDTTTKEEHGKLVALTPITREQFSHYIDLQGRVDAENIAYATPRNGGGQVKAVYVKNGDYVKKGQLLLKLDDAIVKKQIAQAETQLAFAKDMYSRRENLWKENIGTEVELISARTNMEQAQNQLNLIKEQSSFANVYAEMDAVVESATIRVGEMFTGSPLGGHIKLVNTNNLKVIIQIPENYIDKVKVGGMVSVTLPDINKAVDAKITVSGKLIDPNSRSFYVEARLPYNRDFKSNQIALVKLLDYAVPNAITVPVNTLQSDDKGKFVMVASNENGKMVARKRAVTIGELYGEKLEVKTGLQTGEQLIAEGFQDLYEGQQITLQ